MNSQQTPTEPSPSRSAAIGILYAGELGSAIGRALVDDGFRVVTTLAGRSARTRELCRSAQLEVLASLRDVADTADIVISAVPPSAAIQTAEHYCQILPRSATAAPARQRLFLDINSISPMHAEHIAGMLQRHGVGFVDGAVHGLASRLRTWSTVYLSGPGADQVARLFAKALRIRLLGDTPGRASMFKMLIGGMSKGLVALFLEMALTARQSGLLGQLLACYREAYPGIMEVVERMLPTYPQHAARRAEELAEIESTMAWLGLQPHMTSGARQITNGLAALRLPGGKDFEALLEAIADRKPLQP